MGESQSVDRKMASSVKWSLYGEVIAKMITPVASMILARLITPAQFGLVATVNMIVSFADILTDAGFQRYLVQREFADEVERDRNANVAFWSNLALSSFLFALIALFATPLAQAVAVPGCEREIVTASSVIFITAFNSIQRALLRRAFRFKMLFFIRLITVLVPLIVTMPLALAGMGAWALIYGMLASEATFALLVGLCSPWRPRIFYRVALLRDMFSFSAWSLVESVAIWATTWADTFLLGRFLDNYYLGLYKQPSAILNSLTSIVTASLPMVLFSGLSRLYGAGDRDGFIRELFKYQRLIALIVMPMCVGIYLYRDLVTQIMLGPQWTDAAMAVGAIALGKIPLLVLCAPSSEVYRAMGKPRVSVLAQALYLFVLIPGCAISLSRGFVPFVWTRTAVYIAFVLIHAAIIRPLIGLGLGRSLASVRDPALATAAIAALSLLLKRFGSGTVYDLASITLCAGLYLLLVWRIPSTRELIKLLLVKREKV